MTAVRRSQRSSRGFEVHGWIGDYWLASLPDLRRLVPDEPEVRYLDRHEIRWDRVAEVAVDVLVAARAKVADDRSPAELRSWDVVVDVPTPADLTADEAMIIASLFTSEAAVADPSSDQVTNGRHRMFYVHSMSSLDAALPVQSGAVSGWSHAILGDPDYITLEMQVHACAGLYRFAEACRHPLSSSELDPYFVESVGEALQVAEEYFDGIAADASRVDPQPRRLARS